MIEDSWTFIINRRLGNRLIRNQLFWEKCGRDLNDIIDAYSYYDDVAEFQDTNGVARYLYRKVSHQCGTYFGDVEIYFIIDIQTEISPDVIEKTWGYAVQKNSVLNQQTVFRSLHQESETESFDNYEMWLMNSTEGSIQGFQFDQANSDAQHLLFQI
jgi:hypothetical protein